MPRIVNGRVCCCVEKNEAFMSAKKQNGIFLFVMTMLLFAVWGFAAEIDCFDKSNNYYKKNYCVYMPLDVSAHAGLFVIDANTKDTLPNSPLYVYAPDAGPDSVVLISGEPPAALSHKQLSQSGPDGILHLAVVGHFPKKNSPLGVLVTLADNPKIINVFNFYPPHFQFCLDPDCKDTVDVSSIQRNVEDTITVYVRPVVPWGPKEGELDVLIPDSTQYFLSSEHEELKFLTGSGDPMGHVKIDGKTYYLGMILKHKSVFKITSDKALTDVNFTLESSPYTFSNGTTVFRAKEEFPGKIRFVNYDLPSLDSAFIYDTDGDGVGDSIAAYFNGKMDGVSLDNYQYNWPTGGDYTTFSGTASLEDFLLELSGVKTTIPDSAGTGKLKVGASSAKSGANDTLSTDIQDRIGPVIQTATLVPGDGESDYLILSFNKPLDTSWTSGSGFLLDGIPLSMEAVEKGVDGNDRIWKFKVPKNKVKEGSEIEIAEDCAECSAGPIKAADGNKTGKNNPVKISNSGKNFVDDERNGFYDKDGDGRMDSATVAFKEPLSKKDLEEMEVVLYWMDNQGNLLEIKPDLTDTNLVKLSKDGLMLSFTMDEATMKKVRPMLTSVDTTGMADSLKYGFAKVTKPVIQPDGTVKNEVYKDIVMHDRMSPVISGTFLEPESFQKMEADVLTISFSEPVDYEALENLSLLSDCFKFKVDGEWVSIPFSSLRWSDDGKSVKLQLENGVPLAERLNPADSMKFDFPTAGLTDKVRNGVSPKSPPTMVKGDPRVLMQSTTLASLDRAVLLADKAAFTERFVNADEPMDEEMKKSLGILMDISFATVMGEDSTGVSTMNLDDVGLSWELKVFTNLGSYVGGASNKLKCSDPAFEGNCFEHAKKLYLRWNMRSSEGRKVGVGVYVAQFKINVYGAKNSFKVERIYNWGIRAGKGGLSLE